MINHLKLKHITLIKLFGLLSLIIGLSSCSIDSSYATKKSNTTDSTSAVPLKNLPLENLPLENRVPGGIAIIAFEHTDKTKPKVTFQGNRVMVLQRDKKKWVAIIGLSLWTKPGPQQALINGKAHDFNVEDKAYEEQHITLKNKNQVNPNTKSLTRITKESAEMKAVFRSFEQKAPTQLRFEAPLEGRISSVFGLKRFFNGEARNPHSGIDIAAPEGSPIATPTGGRVAAMGNYFFNGNTVLIDHGQGMIAMYCHMQSITVTLNQQVKTGETIGTVGQTGRATGPHLHWSVNLNNARVDPNLFLKGQKEKSSK